MLKWLFGTKQNKSKADKLPAYEESRDIAAKGDVKKRRWLASRIGLQPEFLYYFATDKNDSVRQAVAANETTPLQADKILSRDTSDTVRIELARKISRLLPGINTSRADKVSQMVLEIIHVLAKDKTDRVRSIVSEEIKTLTNVPKELVEELAWDAESIVALPVLEYSPLLSDRHLMEIIRSGIAGGALSAIARRNQLSDKLSSAVASENVEPATVQLLKNITASITEETYGVIANAAQNSSDVLDNLIERDDLTLSTIRRVASFVGNAVLNRIIERHKNKPDVNEEAFRDIRKKISNRIKKGGADTLAIPGEEARLRAEKLFTGDALDETILIKAIDEGERMFVIHSLALLTGFGWENIRDVLNSKTAKTIVALIWKSGFTIKCAVHVQSKFSNIPKPDLVVAGESGDYPFSDEDMEWYLDFFS
jgi:uncharacterized protein (DUF2336 family)